MSQYDLIQLADQAACPAACRDDRPGHRPDPGGTRPGSIALSVARHEATYRLLGREHLAWDRVDLLMGDERYVPADDPLGNARMVRGSLMAEGPGRHACFHPVPTDGADVTAMYAQRSLEHICGSTPPQFGWSCWDLAMTAIRPPCSGTAATGS